MMIQRIYLISGLSVIASYDKETNSTCTQWHTTLPPCWLRECSTTYELRHLLK